MKSTTDSSSSRARIVGSNRQHGIGQQPGERAHVSDLLGKANAAGRMQTTMTEHTRQELDRARLGQTPRISPLRGSRLTFDGRGHVGGEQP